MFFIKINKVKRLTDRSKKVFSAFTDIISDLTKLNDQIAVERAEEVAILTAAQTNIVDLDTQAVANTKLITNITKLIEN